MQAEQRTGVSDLEWWRARERVFDQVFEPARFPTIIAVEAEGGFAAPADPRDYTLSRALADFEFGLARVLDGVEALVRERATSPTRT